MKTAHVIGIGGIGMSATALLLRDMGYAVSGSDGEIYEPVKSLLAHEGLKPKLGFSPDNIQGKPDLILLGRNAKLDPKTNAEVRHALELNTNVRTFPEVIGEAAKGRHTIVSAGSFGKSTTTALLTWILKTAKRDPGYFVGAVAKNLPRTAMLGTGKEFIIEGDEYPTAHGDSRPKFMHYHPDDVLLTSVVHDHVNVYPTFESYRAAFDDLVAMMPASGLLFACADEPGALAFAQAREDSVTYGLNGGDWTARDIHFGNPTRFTLARGGVAVCDLETSQIGRHNIENIVGAAAVAIERRLATIADVQKAIASFDGLRRRLDQIAPQSSMHVIEGFGSSEEKARSAIDAVLLHYPKHPLVVFFEPHTFSWRNRASLPWYDRVFAGSAHVFIAPPESQGAATHEQLTHQEILERVRKSGVHSSPFTAAQTDQAVASLKGNEVVLILTSGDLGGAIPKIVDGISKRFPR